MRQGTSCGHRVQSVLTDGMETTARRRVTATDMARVRDTLVSVHVLVTPVAVTGLALAARHAAFGMSGVIAELATLLSPSLMARRQPQLQ